MSTKKPSLPIDEILPRICRALIERDELVLQAPPGAGKTTAVPLALLDSPWRKGRKILLLEPRRIAARAAAKRMAELLGEALGQRVGYRIRMEKCVSKQTVIEVITEGLLTQMLQSDPELSDVAAIIFDEFHERNLHSDLGLSLSLHARSLFREPTKPLKIVVMSATLDGDNIAHYLHKAPIVTSEGRSFPVDLHYGAGLKRGESCVPAVAKWVRHALQQHRGSILVFLPGQKEIQGVMATLATQLPSDTQLFPLYGNLSFEQQKRAIQPLAEGRKVVLATDIAETSLTIEDITVVVDSGLCRKAKFDPNTGMTRLTSERISKASATQRAGRAGRLGPGYCYRIWREDQHPQLSEFRQPEIHEADMAPLLLSLLYWGVNHPDELQWLDSPKAGAVKQAFQLLQRLGLIEYSENNRQQTRLSQHGAKVAALPLHPRLGHMLQSSLKLNCLNLASLLAAMLMEKTPIMGQGANLLNNLQILLGKGPCPKACQRWKAQCQQQGQRYLQQLKGKEASGIDLGSDLGSDIDSPAILIALAYPDRIGKRRDNSRNEYLLSNGRSATLNENDPLAGEDFLAVSEVGGFAGRSEDKIFSALPLREASFSQQLKFLVHKREQLAWQGDKLLAEQQHCVGAIILQRKPLLNLSDEQYRLAALSKLRQSGLSILGWSEDLRQWQQRVLLLRQHFAAQAWPDVSDENLEASLSEWLGPYLTKIRRLDDFKKLDLTSILHNLLDWPLAQELSREAPTHISVPSGSRHAIDYCQSPPVLKVKLQEMFGCKTTPCIAKGKVPLLVHLLSPAKRPLQITQDLEGFWNSSYQQVKKEMKGRYPKHPWPDNPWEQKATRHTKKRS